MESVSKTSDINFQGKWQWKSNSDPFSETEEPQWKSYLPEENYRIEKAFHEHKTQVDIGDYIVSLQHKIQTKKGNAIAQRPIRRVICEDDEPDVRSERYFETELPKTINKIFGSLEHFIIFFSRRNPEISNFTKNFQELQEANDLNGLNHDILPQLVFCLEEELLKPLDKQLQDHSATSEKEIKALLSRKVRHEALVSLFKTEFTSFGDFYSVIIRSYTMSTNLYLNLNKYLRNENWIALENLLPYAICLCRAFFSFKRNKKTQAKENSIFLYRGTALDEFALSHYQAKESSTLFSWNAVTSTSTSRKMAERFMYNSVNHKNKKYPVLFIIEIPLKDENFEYEYLKWIDIHQYSAMPNEDEVILAPGSAFEVVSVSTGEEEKTTIHVKLKLEVESLAHGGLIMQGAFQNEMMMDKQVKIMCLEGEELFEALKNISGNRLIEEIEFCLCIFDEKSLEEMLLTLTTLEKVRGLKFISCKYEGEQDISSVNFQNTRTCSIEEIEIYEVQDIFRILSQENNFWGSLRTVNIDFRNLEFDDSQFQLFKFPKQLTSLKLNFTGCSKITDEGVNVLASQSLKYLTQLTSLALQFAWCHQITDGFSSLSEALPSLNKLTSLTLDFSWCGKITDKGLTNLASQGIKDLIRLTSLTLSFSTCQEITDEGIKSLASQALQNLTQLTSLALDFSQCLHISQEGVNHLTSQGLKYLTQLTSLNLDFSWCWQISHEEAKILVSQVLKNLTSFTVNEREITGTWEFHQIHHRDINRKNEVLRWNFTRPKTHNQLKDQKRNSEILSTSSEENKEIKGDLKRFLLELIYPEWEKKLSASDLDDSPAYEMMPMGNELPENLLDVLLLVSFEIDSLPCKTKHLHPAPQVPKYFGQLTALTLDFSWCHEITNDGMKNLASQALKNLSHLTSLTLRFSDKPKITDESVNQLASQGLRYLTQLTSLTLDFTWCVNITDKGLHRLATQGLKDLTRLTSLTLHLAWCSITDEGMKSLTSQALQSFSKLTSLTLDFYQCRQLTDEGVNHLTSQGIKYLAKLTSLNLDFSGCQRITDEGLNNLIYHTIKYSTQLTNLSLDFSFCKIAEFTTLSIDKMLRYSGFIQNQKNYE